MEERVGRAHRGAGELGQVHGAADGVEDLALAQVLGDCDQVNGRIAGVKVLKGAEDEAVGRGIEIFGANHVHKGVEQRVAQKNPPKNRLLGFQILGGYIP